MAKRKNPAAVALGQKRWAKKTTAERSEAMRAAVEKRWENADQEKRDEVGQRLAAARAAAREKRK